MYWKLFLTFFNIGLFTIGGGMAMVPVLQKKMVEDLKWMTEEEVIDCVAVCQSLPGVVAVNMATFVGRKKGGLRGALCSTAGILLPSIIIICIVAAFLQSVEKNPYVQGAFTGLRAAAAGLIAWATWKMGKQVLGGKGLFAFSVAIASFVTVTVFGANAIIPILAGALLGEIYFFARAGKEGDDL
ncbi:MAG: chromate transporter [Bacteroidales bacterium]|nr:chromate transporter [Bacteroidales bacterium]